MPYDEYTAERISNYLQSKNANFEARKMMGGLLFMVDDKMLCGIHVSKKTNSQLLMARIGEDIYPMAMKKENVLPMDFTRRPMRGYIFVEEEGIDLDDHLAYWLDLCLAFNPLAKASKKKGSR